LLCVFFCQIIGRPVRIVCRAGCVCNGTMSVCLSVCPFHPLQQHAMGLLLWAQRGEILINSCTAEHCFVCFCQIIGRPVHILCRAGCVCNSTMSVCLSHSPAAAACGGFAAVGPAGGEILINSCTARCLAAWGCSMALSSKCG